MTTLLTVPPLNPVQELFHVERITKPLPEQPPKRAQRVIAVMLAYKAERTLASTLAGMPPGWVDEVILVDGGGQ